MKNDNNKNSLVDTCNIILYKLNMRKNIKSDDKSQSPDILLEVDDRDVKRIIDAHDNSDELIEKLEKLERLKFYEGHFIDDINKEFFTTKEMKQGLACFNIANNQMMKVDFLSRIIRTNNLNYIKAAIDIIKPDALDYFPFRHAVTLPEINYDLIEYLLPHTDVKPITMLGLRQSIINGDMRLFEMLLPKSDPLIEGSMMYRTAIINYVRHKNPKDKKERRIQDVSFLIAKKLLPLSDLEEVNEMLSKYMSNDEHVNNIKREAHTITNSILFRDQLKKDIDSHLDKNKTLENKRSFKNKKI